MSAGASEDSIKCMVQRLTALKHRDNVTLRPLFDLCKTSLTNLEWIYGALMQRLSCENSQIRINALEVIEELFRRSHNFRVLLTNDLQEFLIATVETDVLHRPLPPPKEAAKELKSRSLQSLEQWCQTYRGAYKKLDLAQSYLVTFALSAGSFAGEAQATGRNGLTVDESRRRSRLTERVVDAVSSEFQAMKAEADETLNALLTCERMLVPDFCAVDDSFTLSSNGAASTLTDATRLTASAGTVRATATDINQSETLAAHGFPTNIHGGRSALCIEVTVDLSKAPFEKSQDNESIVDHVRDCLQLIRNSYLPFTERSIKRLTAAGSNDGSLLSSLLQTKMRLLDAEKRILSFNIPSRRKISSKPLFDDASDKVDSVNESDEDFEEVSDFIDGSEVSFKDQAASMSSTMITDSVAKDRNGFDTEAEHPCCSKTLEKSKAPTPPPKIPYGLDLKYWGSEKIVPASVPRNNADCHRFWRPNEDELASEVTLAAGEAEEVYRTRIITFTGEAKPFSISRVCDAPLGEGKRRCPRRDRYRCPLHGPIVDRDLDGNPVVTPESSASGSSSSRQHNAANKSPVPEWQDPQLLADIKAATGRDLTVVRKSRTSEAADKRIRVADANIAKTSRQRLMKKLTDKRVLNRIAKSMTERSARQHDKKFSAFFQYAFR